MNSLFCFGCAQLLLYLISCLYLNLRIFLLLLFQFSPHPTEGRVRKQLCGAELPTGVNHNTSAVKKKRQK